MTGAVEIRDRFRVDPVLFVREVLGQQPWSKQGQILEAVRDHPRVAVRSCHGAGKTAVSAWAALWFLAAHRGSRVITTAPTAAQVRDVLWREIRSAVVRSRGFFDGELFDTKLELDEDWFALGISTDQPERFQGHHAEHLLLVVDEASGVSESIFEAAAGSLTSPFSRQLLIGNPTRTSGEFFSAFHRAQSFYETIAISAYDTPAFTREKVSRTVLRRLVSKKWVEEHQSKWGETSSLFEVRVLGEFPSQGEDAVCALAEVEAAQTRELVPGVPVVVACDVARFGSDETVIALRWGNVVRIVKTYVGRDTMSTAGQILDLTRSCAIGGERPTIVVDDSGVGGGVVDRLREVQREGGGFPVEAFLGANSARDSRDYPNRRSEAWFDFAERLPEIDLDDDEQLAADLTAPRYSLDSQGRRVVEAKAETKRRLGRSPDRADAVLMAFSTRTGRTVAEEEWLRAARDDDRRQAPMLTGFLSDTDF